jgi:hypothetical protein
MTIAKLQTKFEPAHYYADGELTGDKRHRFCRWCDVFWPVGYDCYHFEMQRSAPVCVKAGGNRDNR